MEEKRNILFEPFPKQQEFLDAALSEKYSFILYGGSIRGGKTYALLALFIFLSKVYAGSRWAIIRKDLPTIKRNLYPSWNKIKPDSFILKHDLDQHTVTFKNGSQIIFFPESYYEDKDMNRWKGLEVNGFGFEEINECQEQSFYKAFERAGTYVIKGAPIQPYPIVVATCNPSFGWVKKLVYDNWKLGTMNERWLYIQSRIYDNTPLLEAQPNYLPSLKQNMNKLAYEIFVEGNWDVQMKTGGEYMKQFDMSKHCTSIGIVPNKSIWVSIDENVNPYITATLWQMPDVKTLIQVDEILCRSPYNTAEKAAQEVSNRLVDAGFEDVIFLTGDASTQAKNTITDMTFFDIFRSVLEKRFEVIKRIPKSNPSVAARGAFINAVLEMNYDGCTMLVNEGCKESINDYIETKESADGGVKKERITVNGVSFEKNGHIVDTCLYMVCQGFHDSFYKYINKAEKFEYIIPPIVDRSY